MAATFFGLVLLGVCLAKIGDATVKPTHAPTHNATIPDKKNEADAVLFNYFPGTHDFMMMTNHHCYVMHLSDREQVAIHTDAGMRALEIKLLNLFRSEHVTSVNKSDLKYSVRIRCGHAVTQFYTIP